MSICSFFFISLIVFWIYFFEYFESSNASIAMKIGFKKVISNHRPNAQCLPNLHGILKNEMKRIIIPSGGKMNDKIRHPDIQEVLNRR